MVARATPCTFWLGSAGVDASRGAEDEAASLDSDSVTGYGEKYLNTIFELEDPPDEQIEPREQDVSEHAPSLDLPLSKDDLIEVSLRKQLSMLLDVVLLFSQLAQLGRLCSSAIRDLLRMCSRLGVCAVGDASCAGRGLSSLGAALPFARLYPVGRRRWGTHNGGSCLVFGSRPDELLRYPFV